jgi:hypothetical protein
VDVVVVAEALAQQLNADPLPALPSRRVQEIFASDAAARWRPKQPLPGSIIER